MVMVFVLMTLVAVIVIDAGVSNGEGTANGNDDANNGDSDLKPWSK